MLALSTRDRMMMPGVLQTAKQEGETPAAVREANAECTRQPVKRAAQNQRHHRQLRLCWHANGPRHHVFRHTIGAEHIPRMDKHRRTFVRAVMQKSHNAGVVQIPVPNVLADLYSDMPSPHPPPHSLPTAITTLSAHPPHTVH